MAEDAQANFEAVLNNLLEPQQEVVGAPPVIEEDALGLSSLLGGAKEKAGDLFEWYKRFSYPDVPDQKEDILSDVQIPPEKPTPPTGEQRVFSRLSFRELNPAAIAGIMGNIDVETGGTFSFDRQEDLYKHGDQKGDGYGLFQFTDYKNEEGKLVGHLTEYKKYLEDNNLVDSSESQIDYVLDNIYLGIGEDIGGENRKNLQEVFKSGSPEEVTVMFTKIFERPQKGSEHMDRRRQSAIQRFESISGNRRGGMISRNPYPYNPRPI